MVYVYYGREDDYKILLEKNIDIKGKIVLARYGAIFRGNIVSWMMLTKPCSQLTTSDGTPSFRWRSPRKWELSASFSTRIPRITRRRAAILCTLTRCGCPAWPSKAARHSWATETRSRPSTQLWVMDIFAKKKLELMLS